MGWSLYILIVKSCLILNNLYFSFFHHSTLWEFILRLVLMGEWLRSWCWVCNSWRSSGSYVQGQDQHVTQIHRTPPEQQGPAVGLIAAWWCRAWVCQLPRQLTVAWRASQWVAVTGPATAVRTAWADMISIVGTFELFQSENFTGSQ